MRKSKNALEGILHMTRLEWWNISWWVAIVRPPPSFPATIYQQSVVFHDRIDSMGPKRLRFLPPFRPPLQVQ
ncbi:hypothetical protein BDQ17DRAFT_1356009 [Cyathus striatus]|nr:hypothetical protein BDQ17DRAFT_1356009 [Cyathus striatus]